MVKELHQKFGADFEIMCFPSDEFGGQELATAEEITSFVGTMGLPADEPGFHMMAKCFVNGPSADPVWALAKEAFPGDIQWNFAGIFIFDKEGACVKRTNVRAPVTESDVQSLL
mmetsp:Transcript_13696/g.35223  ORF Transcript_13696/g.35223 Transcript_13696/m.35223 type:complete len:114 (+) Transcript_13696:153-494(+)|eukprot:CAMPEP_0115865852 /NCGR_PEP_ID=MMETSP0287-20121206/19936_1 /TAXON_ID=412157 /ORGANISM="Chrysochromulina rotalis, Strain UIO044" /LENGTH=113 /DNA_ID=CAMNT_0003320379 /DNA_START=154 /DNA_END=495 /DNA_ORIENTATION=+